jgi:hypothetical protein
MSTGIIVFEKNKIDLDNTDGVITITDATATDDGQSIADYMRNRNNYSGWATTGSNDAANTEVEFDFGSILTITDILIVKHNLKSYEIEYWDGAAYQSFTPAINETTNQEDTTHHTFNSTATQKVRLTVTGTMTADSDKIIAQFIATERIGQFQTIPRIEDPELSKERRSVKLISGKQRIIRTAGAFKVGLSCDNLVNENDLSIIEAMFDAYNGFLIWLCGGDEAQFRTLRQGYRLEDIFLMACANDWKPEFDEGFYGRGINIDIELVEVV